MTLSLPTRLLPTRPLSLALVLALATPLAAQGISEVPQALLPSGDEADLRITPVVKAVQRAADSVVSIYMVDRQTGNADGQGSGVILDAEGLVITNWHVVWQVLQSNRHVLQVRLKDNRQLPARVLSRSPEADLALLQLDLGDDERVRPIELGESKSLMVGETLIAIGNPQGHANTVTVGVLSAVDRSIRVRAPDGRVRDYGGLLQTDAAINQGNSGGALLDINGKLIGINNAMAASAENIGFAIPVDTVKEVFGSALLSAENLAAAWLGFGVAVDDVGGAVVVDDLVPGGPGARAGLRNGDRITGVNGQPVRTEVDYLRHLVEARPGSAFPLEVERGDRSLTAEPIPLSRAMYEVVQRIGVEVETVTAEREPDTVRSATLALFSTLRRGVLPATVRITRVYADSPAAELGLAAGDVMLGFRLRDFWSYREVPFLSAEDLAGKLRAYAGQSMVVWILRDGRELEGTLKVL